MNFWNNNIKRLNHQIDSDACHFDTVKLVLKRALNNQVFIELKSYFWNLKKKQNGVINKNEENYLKCHFAMRNVWYTIRSLRIWDTTLQKYLQISKQHL